MKPTAASSRGEGYVAETRSNVAELVRRIQAGEQAADTELVERFSHGLLLMLRRLTGNLALAEDLRQETLSLVLEKIRCGEVREPERLAGFIRSLARNLFIADRRKEARYTSLDGSEGETRPAQTLTDRSPAPLDRVLADEEARQVQQLLNELRFDRDRQLLIRFYLSDQSKEEICEDLDLEPERFNQLLFRARERLREIWERTEKRRRFFSGVRKMVGSTGGDPSLRT